MYVLLKKKHIYIFSYFRRLDWAETTTCHTTTRIHAKNNLIYITNGGLRPIESLGWWAKMKDIGQLQCLTKKSQLQQTNAFCSCCSTEEGGNMVVVTAEYTLCRFDKNGARLIFHLWRLSLASLISVT